MRIAIILALTLIACPLVAVAADECGDPYKGGVPGQAMMDVELEYDIESCRVLGTEGPVTVDLGNCETPGSKSCTWSAQGDPKFDGPQSAVVEFDWVDCDTPVVCTITTTGGLPVELLSVSVE